MNPRRPTPSGPKPNTPLTPHQLLSRGVIGYADSGITDNHVIQEFMDWCTKKGTSLETCRQYGSYLTKPLDLSNKWSRLAWKAFFKFLGRDDLWKEIKVKRSGVDLYVPSDEEVLKALQQACSTSEALCWVYKLLVYSGLRLSEVCKLLREQEDDKWTALNGFYKYPLSWRRGSKQVFYCYTVEKPPKISVSDKWVTNWASKHSVLNPKYVRKWVATKMLQLNIPEEVVNFVQGRTPSGVLAKHYLKLSLLADQYYVKYALFLTGLVETLKS